ncbi:hypothetical protein AURDEDRAFT_116956 [Auricularia subglabra TFB-10046 SS5]|uniref:Uncharacterized protein n=1 Tax=Auricularia subglabra (strain TFB-10046 / SS5) TaxID=717982 RepID=J0CZG1_AURST|nr:hypothetical protein AURDEDRAFT_116956 [Auricularia subglabra TFB-10046 SS5]
MDDDRLAEQESLSYGSHDYDDVEQGEVRQARLGRLARGLFKTFGRMASLRDKLRRRRNAYDEDIEALAGDPDEFGFTVDDQDADETLLDVDLAPKFADELCDSPTSTRAFSFTKINANGDTETPSRRSSISLPFLTKDDAADTTLTQDGSFVLADDLQAVACGRRSGEVIHIPVVPALGTEIPVRSVYAEQGWHEPLFDGRLPFLHALDYDERSCSTVPADSDSECEPLLSRKTTAVRI